MNNIFCPNYSDCQIIKSESIVKDSEKKQHYINNYCESNENGWKDCKRYNTKGVLNFCPDFVLPDTILTINEILNKIEE